MTGQSNLLASLTINPMQTVWRFVSATLFSGAAFGWYVYSSVSSEDIFALQRRGLTISVGLTMGVFWGLVLLLTTELPERAISVLPGWARLMISLAIGFVGGVVIWALFGTLVLYDFYDFTNLAIGGIGLAVAVALRSTFRVPAWLAALWAAAAIFASMYITWFYFMPPLIYPKPGEELTLHALVMAALIGIGAYLPVFIHELRGRRRHVETPEPTPVSP